MPKRFLILYLCVSVGFAPAIPTVAKAESASIPGLRGNPSVSIPVAPNALPVVRDLRAGVAGLELNSASNTLTIHQDKPKAVIDWKSFDIGKDARTHFDQQGNKNWSALNRIFDQNPSQIQGKLTADGKIFLINQNGILFGPNSTVNVHSLTASTMNIKDEDFLDDVLKFKSEDYIGGAEKPRADVAVSNYGSIAVDQLGSVFLMAPTVENSGSIKTTAGQIALAAGGEVGTAN
ncbi:MAG: filamentous hemagglutinin N-terminal domain-containing protein [Syntrophobacteraceae bacterium]